MRMRGKGSSHPCWYIKDPPFPSSHIKAVSTHLPTPLWTKEGQLMFPLRPQIWEQEQQEESHSIMEPDFAILFAPLPPVKLKPHVSMSHYSSQNPSSPSSSPVSSAPSWHQGHSSLQQQTEYWKGMLRGFSISLVLKSRINSIHSTRGSSHILFWNVAELLISSLSCKAYFLWCIWKQI